MRTRALTALLAVVALTASACGMGPFASDDDMITVTAVFSDVIDLVADHSVRAGDVPIGLVDSIELTDDEQALVTMTIDGTLGLPKNTTASLAKTGLLGERFIDLRAPDTGRAGQLEDGDRIARTTIVTDFEDLVRAGGDVLAFVSADRLGAAVETGAIAFGGREALIGRFVDDVNGFVGTFEDNEDVLLALIDSLDALTAAYVENADANAAVLADLQEASEAFQTQDDKLLDTLEEVSRLSTVGGEFLETNQEELHSNLVRLRRIVGALTAVDGGLEGFLEWFPRHNKAVPSGAINEKAQVYLDFIVCGVTETEGDVSRDCTAPNPGQQGVLPPFFPFSEECFDDYTKCEDSPQSGGDGIDDGYQG